MFSPMRMRRKMPMMSSMLAAPGIHKSPFCLLHPQLNKSCNVLMFQNKKFYNTQFLTSSKKVLCHVLYTFPCSIVIETCTLRDCIQH